MSSDRDRDEHERGLSIVCVFNDPEVRRACLDRSLLGVCRTDLELIALDNTAHAFSSAGAALNHGARQARFDVVVCVHQDVYLHSVARLHAMAEELRNGPWGMLGAVGVTSAGEVVGTLRDRVTLIGASTSSPVEVDSLDEVLFMAERHQLIAAPLSEEPDLSWHAYAVEYAARLRSAGKPTGAADAGITHNSMSINLARLDEAHAAVARMHPGGLPLHTTCGVVGRRHGRVRDSRVLRAHGWRRRWWRESVLVRRSAQTAPTAATVLADIRMDVDSLVWSSAHPLRVVNLDHDRAFASYTGGPLRVERAGRPVEMTCAVSVAEAGDVLASRSLDESVLVTNVRPDDVGPLVQSGDEFLLGAHESDLWLLVGPATRELPEQWRSPRATPWRARSPRPTTP